MVAGVATGLRPGEWLNARETSEGCLVVTNLKATYLGEPRANSPTRTLRLGPLPEDVRDQIRWMLILADRVNPEMTDETVRRKYWETLQNRANYQLRAAWRECATKVQKRKPRPVLYSFCAFFGWH